MQSLHRISPFVLSLIVLTIASAVKTQEPIYYNCPNTTTFARNSTYETNLRSLLSSLASNGSRSTGFYNSSNGRDPDDVYGLYLCRGDVSTNVCQQCVNVATRDILSRFCPQEKETVVYYDECLLRYSNTSVSPNMSSSYTWQDSYFNITGNRTSFNDLVTYTLRESATEAAASSKKFSVRNVSSTNPAQKLYSLVQCTPDLSTSDCQQCFQQIIGLLPDCCADKQGGRVLTPSCNFRYEVFEFFDPSALQSPSPPPSQLSRSRGSNLTRIIVAAIVVPIAVSILLFCAGYCLFCRRSKEQYNIVQEDNVVNEITDVESLRFDFATLEVATNNFSPQNKLGQGGFGEVYKGTLPSGQEIAVKRLSKYSGQGGEEFKNEVLLVAKLQHRNLVRLLGFCLEGEEKILVYEYVPNKSLDYSLFDPKKQGQLDWLTRCKIMGGISRGMLYLHQDSRLRIIHRDLKASNILLDGDMNPKISDFGMARIFCVDQTQGSTSRIVGTYGYMPPEYVMHGHFSVKSDVYSFGVLVLEIITGKKNSSFCTKDSEDLLSYVWKHWRDGTPVQVLDPTLADAYSRNEVIECIQIGLLCVQEDPADRPTMETVAILLNSYSVALPDPQRPAFFHQSRSNQSNLMNGSESEPSTTTKSTSASVNVGPITEVYTR